MSNVIVVGNQGRSNRFLLLADDFHKTWTSFPFKAQGVLTLHKELLEDGAILIFDAMDDLLRYVSRNLRDHREVKFVCQTHGGKRKRAPK